MPKGVTAGQLAHAYQAIKQLVQIAEVTRRPDLPGFPANNDGDQDDLTLVDLALGKDFDALTTPEIWKRR